MGARERTSCPVISSECRARRWRVSRCCSSGRSFATRRIGRFTRDLTIAAIALILYGLVGQFFATKTDVFPSDVINADLFRDVMGFPIQLFRTVMAVTVAVFMIRVLRALEVESQQRLEAAEDATAGRRTPQPRGNHAAQ